VSEGQDPEPVVAAGSFGAKSILRTLGAAALVLLLVLLGVVIGTHFGPHVMKVEQRVVGPVRLAAYSRNDLQAMPDIVAQACSAVVVLRGSGVAQPVAGTKPKKQRRRSGKSLAATPPMAVGFFVSPDGYLLAAAGALPKGSLEAVLSDGRALPTKTVAIDALSGLALMKVEASDVTTLQFADDAFPRIGQTTIALAPASASGCEARSIFISGDFVGDGEGLRAYILSQGPLDPRWSGAPVLDLRGDVVGVAGLGPANGHDSVIAALLPGTTASHVVDRLLRESSAPANGYGFEAEDIGPTLANRLGADRGRGAVVTLVAENSPADQAGLKAGDIIVGVAGQPVSGASEFARLMDDEKSALVMQIQRRGAAQTVQLPSIE
jgi:serine protease Do